MKMKIFLISLVAVLAVLSCQDSASGLVGTSTPVSVSFVLTDAPVDPADISAVNIVVSGVSVNESGTAADGASSWTTTTLDTPVAVNLLSLQNGLTSALGDISITGGTQINQIKLTVDSVTVVETDASEHVATLPSTGFKIVNAFQVPLSGDITIAVDFDVRKAIVSRGNNQGYLVKPAIRAVISGEAGKITGSVGTTGAIAVYAYTDNTYAASEIVEDSDGATFANAYSSTLVKTDGTYVLAFMDAGVYDLFAVNAAGTVVGTLANATVAEGATTAAQNFTLSSNVSFELTDAPVNPADISAVNIVVSGVSVNESGTAVDGASSWITTKIVPPLTVNLLSLQNGLTSALGGIPITGGTQINQIKLAVDSVTIVETDASEHVATLPSTGFKIVNAFQVPLSGNIGIAIDFDVRKALVSRGNNQGYLVKPSIRAVISGEAGKITGSVGTAGAIAVYAYADGTYAASEIVEDSDGATFANAYSSTLVKTDGTYVLAFMDEGIYDLYAVNSAGAITGTLPDVTVMANSTTAAQNF